MKKSLQLRLISSIFFISIFIVVPVFSQSQKFHTAEISHAVKLGRTRPLYDVIPMGPADSLKLKEFKNNRPKYIPNFVGRRPLQSSTPGSLPTGADPLFNPNHVRTPEYEILPTLSFEGIAESNVGANVPDVNGDIGRDFFVEIVNATHFRVFDKTGQPVSGLITANSIWSQLQQFSAGDPILLYDQAVDRWFLTEFPFNNRVLLGISVTGDPRGSWDVYTFQTPQFPDFPKYGIWNDAYYLTTNEGGADFPIYAFNRSDILAGNDIVRFQRLTAPKHFGNFFEVGQPVDWDGMTAPPAGSPALVVKINDDDWNTTAFDQIMLHKITIDWENSANSNIEIVQIATAPFDTDGCSLENTGGFSCIPQPNNQGIDGAQWIITNKAQYRNFGTHESFVLSFMVDVTGEDVAGIRWMEFRKTSSLDWYLYQEGTIGSDDGLHRFMSSIGIDGQGNIGVAYSVSGFDKHPSLRFTGRYANDPLGVMTFKEHEFATGGGSLGNDRYGDYASMSVDPSDDKTFWFAGEYVPSENTWSTRIVAFSASRDTIDLLPVTLVNPKNNPALGNNEPVTMQVLNRGLNTIYDFSLAYKFENETWVVEEALVDSLPVDSIYEHTFQQGLDFPLIGNYSLRIASILDEDRNHLNDTLSFIIRKPAYRDIALEYVVPGVEPIICGDNGESSAIIRNLGVNVVSTIELEVLLNGSSIDTHLANVNLPFGDEQIFTFTIPDLVAGANEITLNVLSVNGNTDEVDANDSIIWTITAKPDGAGVFLNLTTDNFPQETTWELVDTANHLLASGGPYAEQQNTYVSSFCLDPDACYTFILYDAFGDGMSAQGVQGTYQIFNDEGMLQAALGAPNFGDVHVNEFCLSTECSLHLFVGVQHESEPGAGDAWVIGAVANGLGNITYSLDGNNFQSDNTFPNLPPGTYTMIALDDSGCSDTVSFTIISCLLQTFVTTKPASGGDIGEIHIAATGGIAPYLYSLNGSPFFVPDSFFTMLEPGNYWVTTRDSAGCERTDSVIVSTHVSTVSVGYDPFIVINPNPGKGVFQLKAQVASNEIFLRYTVVDLHGNPVIRGTLGKYNDQYKGELSLMAYPSGSYFILFYIGDSLTVRRVIKTE